VRGDVMSLIRPRNSKKRTRRRKDRTGGCGYGITVCEALGTRSDGTIFEEACDETYMDS
jgi:hypothetical protein